MYNPCGGFITDKSIGQNKCTMSYQVFRNQTSSNQTYNKRRKLMNYDKRK